MKRFIKRIYFMSPGLRFIGGPFINAYKYLQLQKYLPSEKLVQKKFKQKFGYLPNLKNPCTFNEKMNWLKLNVDDPRMTVCADKYSVRKYVEERIGDSYLIPMLYSTTNPNDIHTENIPDLPCIIKLNHDSSGGVIIHDKNKVSNWDEIRGKLEFGMKQNYFWVGREPQYRRIKPRIIIEQLLLDENGQIPSDYKLHFMNGKLGFIQVDTDRHINHKRTLFDPDWNQIPCKWIYPLDSGIEKPKMLEKMVALGELLAKDFLYVRVDFYCLNDRIYFGELTFHSEGGGGAFDPVEYDLNFGSMLNLC